LDDFYNEGIRHASYAPWKLMFSTHQSVVLNKPVSGYFEHSVKSNPMRKYAKEMIC
jgi:hypothetical protein